MANEYPPSATDLPAEVQAMLGKPLYVEQTEFPIEQGYVLSSCAASQNGNPLYWQADVAKELTLTGRVIDAEHAHALGLVTHVSADPLAHARQLAAEIASRSPDAVAAGKFLLQQAYAANDRGALAAERRWQRRIIARLNQRIALARNRGQADKPFARRRIG